MVNFVSYLCLVADILVCGSNYGWGVVLVGVIFLAAVLVFNAEFCGLYWLCLCALPLRLLCLLVWFGSILGVVCGCVLPSDLLLRCGV